MNLYDYLPKQEKTFEKFRRFLFQKVQRDKEKFRKFSSYPDTYKLPIIIEFLESEGVPVLPAMCFYSYKHPGTPSFIELLKFTVIAEFARIEKGVNTNYIPF